MDVCNGIDCSSVLPTETVGICGADVSLDALEFSARSSDNKSSRSSDWCSTGFGSACRSVGDDAGNSAS